jgi:hypothetical protein
MYLKFGCAMFVDVATKITSLYAGVTAAGD